jgi:hypothetical protein
MGSSGTATLDFGAFPGKSEASIAVTSETGIVAGSLVEAFRLPTVATADKTTDEQLVERLRVTASDIVAGTGFTIRGYDDASPSWKTANDGIAEDYRLYGKFLIGWVWV